MAASKRQTPYKNKINSLAFAKIYDGETFKKSRMSRHGFHTLSTGSGRKGTRSRQLDGSMVWMGVLLTSSDPCSPSTLSSGELEKKNT